MTAKYIIKILTLGDTLVGKSSIVLRFSDNRFDDNQLATIGIDYKTKYIKVKDASVKVLLWDTAGQEKFRNIARQYYKGANGVLLIYDVCDRKSYERIGFWMDELKQNNEIEQLYIILVGNKIDNEKERKVTTEEGKRIADSFELEFFETSAKTGLNIDTTFNKLVKKTVETYSKTEGKGEKLNSKRSGSKKGCC